MSQEPWTSGIGAFTLWGGWWLCAVYACNKFAESWWLDPHNLARALQLVRNSPLDQKGGPQWHHALRDHPATISEMMGATDSAQGAVAKAICLPALSLVLIGGFMVSTSGPHIAGAFAAFYRASAPGVGLMMVIYTPVLTLCPEFLQKRQSSELEDVWWQQWIWIHILGFMLAFVALLFFELPAMISELLSWSASTVALWMFVRYARLFLVVLRLATVPCSLASLFAYGVFPSKCKVENTQSYMSFLGEMSALQCLAFYYMFKACAILLESLESNMWLDAVLWACMTAYTTFKFMAVPGMLWQLFTWDKTFVPAFAKQYTTMHDYPMVAGLQKLTGTTLWHLRIIQAGHSVPGDEVSYGISGKGFGGFHPQIMQFVVRPWNYMTIQATEWHQLTKDDLLAFNDNLVNVLKVLTSAKIMYFPYGNKFKFNRKMPFLRLSCADYAAEVARIDPTAKINDKSHEHENEIDAYDITEKVLADPRTSFLAKTPLIEALAASDCFGMYDFFGTFLGDSTPPFFPGQFLDRPWLEQPEGLHYEIQVQGLTAARPVILLHALKGTKLPEGWNLTPSAKKLHSSRTCHLEEPSEPKGPTKRR